MGAERYGLDCLCPAHIAETLVLSWETPMDAETLRAEATEWNARALCYATPANQLEEFRRLKYGALADVLESAAAEIERLKQRDSESTTMFISGVAKQADLQAEVERLREALRPFAAFSVPFDPGRSDTESLCRTSRSDGPVIRLGDCRRAREALEGKP